MLQFSEAGVHIYSTELVFVKICEIHQKIAVPEYSAKFLRALVL